MYRREEKRRGNAIVEFAVASSAVFLMALGAVDFGRMFYDSIAIAAAAQAGVQRGTFSHLAANETTSIESATAAALTDTSGASISSEQFCDCPDNPGVAVDCKTARCTGYGLSRMYIHVRVEKDFDVFGPWPGIPEKTEIDLSNWTRVR